MLYCVEHRSSKVNEADDKLRRVTRPSNLTGPLLSAINHICCTHHAPLKQTSDGINCTQDFSSEGQQLHHLLGELWVLVHHLKLITIGSEARRQDAARAEIGTGCVYAGFSYKGSRSRSRQNKLSALLPGRACRAAGGGQHSRWPVKSLGLGSSINGSSTQTRFS